MEPENLEDMLRGMRAMNIRGINTTISHKLHIMEVIKDRLAAVAKTRPLLKNQDIEAIRKRFKDRLPFYADCDYKIHITSGKTPAEYAMEILKIADKAEV